MELVDRYQPDIAVQGDYVEKKHIQLFFIGGQKGIVWKLPLIFVFTS